ncbi:MAG: T9SS type A sorting domain-containing protein [Bacteroides sp.]
MYNAQGFMVVSGVLDGSETHINTSSFPAGMYLLRLRVENGATKTYRVVKQ